MNIDMNSAMQRILLVIIFMGTLVLQRQDCFGQYSFTEVPVGGDVEYRLYYDQFHFGTIVETPQNAFIFRPHPDQFDVNGWGTSEYLNPFLAGGEPSQGVMNSISPNSQGIQISLSGQVNRIGQTNYGEFDSSLLFSYNKTFQTITGSGNLHIELPGALNSAGKDLNLSRIASNMLTNVPLQTGSTGVTGDMSQALVNYALVADPRDFIWYPPDLPCHYPQDFSSYLSIKAVGTVNVVDTLALGEGFQIAIARKPSLQLAFQEQSPPVGNILNFGGCFDTTKAQDFSADNIGMNHLVQKNRTTQTTMNFSVNIESQPGMGLRRNLLWNQTGATWDTAVANRPWVADGQGTFFILDDQVTFGNTGVGNVVISAYGVAPDSVEIIHDSGNYTFSGGTIGGSTGLNKDGLGALTLENNNTYIGETTILSGTLALDTQGQISSVSLINNNGTFKILHGEHFVGDITGSGTTQIDDGELTAKSISQGTLSIGPGAKVTIQPYLSSSFITGNHGSFAVPEPVGPIWMIGLGLWLIIYLQRSYWHAPVE